MFLVFRVSLFMYIEFVVNTETFAAFGALKWFLSYVNLLVFQKTRLLLETLLTDGTLKSSVVRLLVLDKLVAVQKTFPAVDTFEWILTRVDSYMGLKLSLS